MVTVPRPALATLSRAPFWREGWIYERKLDGQRCLAVRENGETLLYSRSGREVTALFPEIAAALAGQVATDCVLDGEVVAFEGDRTSFAQLQPRIRVSSAKQDRDMEIPVWFYAFDLLEVDGEDVRSEPLLERKRRLRALVGWEDPIRFTPHRLSGDDDWFREICQRGWEGLVAKRADAAYPMGRTSNWLKFKCDAGQELVIVGWTDPMGSRTGLGALLLGYHDHAGDGADLVYAGKVGTGFTDTVLLDLQQRLSRLEVDRSPCTGGNPPSGGVHWVRPELVAEVAFSEWTAAGQLRHPRYLGLREDKAARDVVRERT